MNDKLETKTVLVTGAGGFIGSALVNELLNLGASVRAFLRYTSRRELGLLQFLPKNQRQKLDLFFGNLTDPDALEQATQDVDIVFHLGALIAIPYSYLHPVDVVNTNIIGTLNVLQACRKNDCRLIHTSTSEVYGSALRIPIDETHPLQGQSPYSASKIGADKIVESYYRSYDLKAVTVRPFNTYGPGQSNRAVIPTIISQALTSNVIRLGNLTAKRDFTFVSDTVNGFIKAAQTQDIEGETFNLGYGSDISIGELTELIIDIIGKSCTVEVETQRLRPEKSEVTRLISDNSKAKSVLGWAPEVDFRDGLTQTISWINQHLDLYTPEKYVI
ncbi:GDP-mannose 4,6-dehydratase [bacterium]|nr:GDP-mannose 4,6-dehydratase [bacterium]